VRSAESRLVWSLLIPLCLFAFAWIVRGLGFEQVIADDMVVIAPADAMYHMRRAYYSFVNFPSMLLFDPYLNYPDGVPVPWPPLFDFVMGGLARLLASDQRGFEVVMAWGSTIFGSLTVFPVYWIARKVSSRRVAVGAALLFAVFPDSVGYARVGNPDHHSAVAFVGAWLLWLCVSLVDPEADDRRLDRLQWGLAVGRLAAMLVWHGNLLYLALLEGTLLLAASLSGRSRLFRVECLSAITTAVCLIPILENLPIPIGGAFSSISLSALHLVVVSGTAVVAGSLWWLEAHRPPGSFVRRLGWMTLVGCAFLAAVFAFPEPRKGLEPALRFVSMTDGVGLMTAEQFPLFAFGGRQVLVPPERAWAYFAYLIPLAPFSFVFLLSGANRRPAAWVLSGWCLVFGLLAIDQRRYGNDLAPVLSIAFSLMLLELPLRLTRRWPRSELFATAGALAISIGLLSPTLFGAYLPRLQGSLRVLMGDHSRVIPVRNEMAGNLIEFGRKLRAATPDTAGFLDSSATPEYGILAEPNLGHVLHYVGRRATATDPMWAYIGPRNWELSHAFLDAKDEKRALALARKLRGRFAVTSGTRRGKTILSRLHRTDGVAGASGPRLAHFRLIEESRPGIAGLGEVYRPNAKRERSVPYKLFEIVPGAELLIRAEPGVAAEASITIRAPSGREFVYFAGARVEADGMARVRVPYPSDESAPVRARSPYRVRVGELEYSVEVSEEQVQSGATIEVGGV
jgi:asparagine N-glycosylation enzyme membrane subunit Stt3